MMDEAREPDTCNRTTAMQAPLETSLVDCHVLLAEDGVDNQRLVAHLLKKAGRYRNGRPERTRCR